ECPGSASARCRSGGDLGPAHAPFLIGRGTETFASEAFQVSALDPPSGVSVERLLDRRRLLETVASAEQGASQSVASGALHNFQERAFDLVTGPAARQAFDLSREPVEVRDRYGRHPVGQNLLAARRLIESGARLVSV